MINVLIVDDHALFRSALNLMLKSSGKLKVIGQAANGEEAIEFIKKNKVDLVLLDIEMPVMNGLECAQYIKQNFPSIKILILTMHNGFDVIKKALSFGVEGFFIKSASVETLLDGIKKIANGGEAFDEEVVRAIIDGLRKENTKTLKTQELDRLSEREKEILKLIAQGLTTLQIAENLKVSKYTIDAHRKNMVKKFGANNTAELIQLMK